MSKPKFQVLVWGDFSTGFKASAPVEVDDPAVQTFCDLYLRGTPYWLVDAIEIPHANHPNHHLDRELDDIMECIIRERDRLEVTLTSGFDRQKQNKVGMEIHSKLDRIKDELTHMQNRSLQYTENQRWGFVINEWRATTRRLIVEVFKIEADDSKTDGLITT